MGKPLDKSTLGYLGEDFQFKLVKCFIEQPKFFRQAYPIIQQNVFTEPSLRRLVGYFKDYYEAHEDIPSYETVSIMHRSKCNDELEIELFDGLIERLRETSTEGSELIKENALKFFKQQKLIQISKTILEKAKSGDLDAYDDCQRIWESARFETEDDEFGCSPYDLLEQALTPTYNTPIQTGIKEFDEDLNGGLCKGKMGLLIGSAGFGKSTFSTSIALHAATTQNELNNYEGFKVLQLYFEDDEVDIARKHFSKITQVEARKLAFENSRTNEIREILENYENKELVQKNLRLKRMPTGVKSASDIESFIKKMINKGFKPDLVIVDYFECLASEKGGYSSDSEWTREGKTMRKLENMAKDLDIALWVPTQGNKDSFVTETIVGMNNAGGSVKKVQIAQVVASFTRSLDDIDNNRARMTVLKNRSGKSGRTYSLYFNNGTSTIRCDESMTFGTLTEFIEQSDEDQYDANIRRIRQLREESERVF